MDVNTIKAVPKGKKTMFIGLFGVSLAAFAAGFDSCLFDIDKAGDCVSHAEGWISRFQAVGDHIIAWIMAIFKAAFSG